MSKRLSRDWLARARLVRAARVLGLAAAVTLLASLVVGTTDRAVAEPRLQESRLAEPAVRVLPADLAAQASQSRVGLPKTEGFEGPWPNDWALFGNPSWDPDSCNPQAGSYSGWAAGGGAGSVPGCTNYPNDMLGWIVYGPFSLAGATAAGVDFWFDLESEPDYDWLFTGASTDGASFNGQALSGNGWGGWRNDYPLSLASWLGAPQVWVAFVFDSDATVNNFRGAYLDSINIWADAVPPPCYLEMVASPPEGGTTVPPPGVHEYDCDTQVPIDAIPNPGWQFVGWSGSADCADWLVVVDGYETCIADFVPIGEIVVRVGSDSVIAGGEVTVPVEALDVPPGSIGSFTIEVDYDPALLEAIACTPDPGGIFDFANCNPTYDSDNVFPDLVRCTGVSISGVSGPELALCNITFESIDPAPVPLPVVTPLSLDCPVLTDPGGIPIGCNPVYGEIEIIPGILGDVNCDLAVNVVDALFILQYEVGLRADSGVCPLPTEPPPPPAIGWLNASLAACDVNYDLACNVVDALFILQCEVGMLPGADMPFCLAAQPVRQGVRA